MTYGELPQGAYFRLTISRVIVLQKLEQCACTMDSKLSIIPDDTVIIPELADMWSCFTCGYFGSKCVDDEGHRELCPDCGTRVGDGFGMAENDPRYREAR